VNHDERLATRWHLRHESEVTKQILQNTDLTVDEFIARFRMSRVRRSFPGEYLGRTLHEAFESGDPRVRKLLLDSRWVKR
jgi:hypothetical protein